MNNINRTILMAFATIMCLTACNRADIGSALPDNNEIRFGSNGVVVGTKALVETTGSLLQANGFRVCAVIDENNEGIPETMFNSVVSFNSDANSFCVPGKSYYFPNSGTMSFYAVYPSTENLNMENFPEVGPSLSYTHNTDEDLVVAKTCGVVKQASPVMMNFVHVLSQLSVTCTGLDSDADYKLRSISISSPSGGDYYLSRDEWELQESKEIYTIYSNASGVSVNSKTAIGETISLLPGTININVVWDCYNKGTSTLISENNQTVELELVKGKHMKLNLSLPSNSSSVSLASSVGNWMGEDKTVQVNLPEPLKFSSNGEQTLSLAGAGAASLKIQYSFDKITWNDLEYLQGMTFGTTEHQNVYLRGENSAITCIFHFSTDKKVSCSGNMMSLVNYKEKIYEIPTSGCFEGVFKNCSVLTSAPELPATILKERCYKDMFYGCTSLTTGPVLPSQDIKMSCYGSMFYGCTNLSSVTIKAKGFMPGAEGYSAFTDFLKDAGTSAENPRMYVDPTMVDHSVYQMYKGVFTIVAY